MALRRRHRNTSTKTRIAYGSSHMVCEQIQASLTPQVAIVRHTVVQNITMY